MGLTSRKLWIELQPQSPSPESPHFLAICSLLLLLLLLRCLCRVLEMGTWDPVCGSCCLWAPLVGGKGDQGMWIFVHCKCHYWMPLGVGRSECGFSCAASAAIQMPLRGNWGAWLLLHCCHHHWGQKDLAIAHGPHGMAQRVTFGPHLAHRPL